MNLQDFKLERFFAKYEFTTEFLLCTSDCESMSLGDVLALEQGAQEQLERVWLGYTESTGSPALRREIAKIYTSIEPDEILVHAGAEEAIFLFMHAVFQPGDHAVVHTPCYQSLTETARSAGAQVSAWRAREENGWALDADDLQRMLRPETRAVIINTPHNPTGYLMDAETMREVQRITQERGIVLFCDEVYRELEHNPADRLAAACDGNPLAVSLGVLSKAYGLAGLRIGWVATHNRAIYQKMAALKDYTSICNSAPSELLAEIALRHREMLAQRNRELVLRNLTILDGFFARHAGLFFWPRPRAGSIAFPRLIGQDVEAFCDRLAREAGVLLAPGSLFGDAGNHFRVGFGRANLPLAVERLEKFLGGGWQVL
ncbi:MAG: aminotransferase class I/II-fold pyridoxal phosphate-dependent enzyme [Anaerolineaceae bacterium]|nr:aminotransferase class I/II-fold pyridoxal phosphate-dependent enzyme [Anaerolineaceae bacterium]